MRTLAIVAFLLVSLGAASATFCNAPCLLGHICAPGLNCNGGICGGKRCQSMGGDPEMKGLDGRTFFFDGEAGKVFNLISEQNHQVNALFVEGPHKIAVHGSEGEHNGTFIGAMGFKLYDTKVEIEVDEEGEMTVLMNGQAFNLTSANKYEETFVFDKVTATASKFRPGMGQTVHLLTDLYNLMVYATPRQWDEDVQQVTRGHLNLAMAVESATYFMTQVHGVLGQISPNTAADNSFLPPELQTAFLGEGVDMDYVVSDLFADDFKYNLYHVKKTPALSARVGSKGFTAPKTAVSRRRLYEEPAHKAYYTSVVLPRNF